MLNPNPTAPRRKDRLSMLRDQMDAENAMNGPQAGKPMVTGSVAGGIQKAPPAPPPQKPANNLGAAPPAAPAPKPQKPAYDPMNPIGSTAGFAPRPAAPPAPAADPHEDMYNAEEEFIRSLLDAAGNVDTSDEEAAIRESMDRLMGKGLVDARARGGAAGFAMSGQQLAAEGGVRKDAALQESQQIIDARNKAQQDAVNNALRGIGADVSLLGASEDAQIFDMIMELLGQEPPADEAAPDGGGGGGDGDPLGDVLDMATGGATEGTDVGRTLVTKPGVGLEQLAGGFTRPHGTEKWLEHLGGRVLDDVKGQNDPAGRENAAEAPSAQDGWVMMGADGGWTYYVDEDGGWHKVKVKTMSGDY